jgi:hypothetical protein
MPFDISSFHIGIQVDYKSCKLLHIIIGKKVIAAQKLNSRHCKEKLKSVFSARTRKYVLISV